MKKLMPRKKSMWPMKFNKKAIVANLEALNLNVNLEALNVTPLHAATATNLARPSGTQETTAASTRMIPQKCWPTRNDRLKTTATSNSSNRPRRV